MYLKLAIRNAKRSGQDYLLYITTLTILIAIMTVSNLISVAGNTQADFQTSSLPILITVIMIVLFRYINQFVLKQRSREFATYILLGISRNNLAWMFFGEFLFLGIICLIIGSLLGIVCFAGLTVLFSGIATDYAIGLILIKASLHTGFYFFIVEIFSLLGMIRIVKKLEINQLILQKRRNQIIKNYNTYKRWVITALLCFITVLGLIIGIVFLPNNIGTMLISIVSVPVLLFVFSFYKAIFLAVYAYRQNNASGLYQNNRLYIASQLLSDAKSNTTMSCVLCICLICSCLSFLFGCLLLRTDVKLFELSDQYYMGFLQISISIIFIAIYFSILSVRQIIEIQQEQHNLNLLQHMGKTKKQIKSLLALQICLKFCLPVIVCFLLLVCSAPLINYKLNTILAVPNLIITALFGFSLCFIVLYSIYSVIVYHICCKSIHL